MTYRAKRVVIISMTVYWRTPTLHQRRKRLQREKKKPHPHIQTTRDSTYSPPGQGLRQQQGMGCLTGCL